MSVPVGPIKPKKTRLCAVLTFRNGIRDDIAGEMLPIVPLRVRASQLLTSPLPTTTMQPVNMGARFVNLPVELHEIILDHLFGERTATCLSRGKHSAVRHPRRKTLSNLALICQLWTPLVQGRIYRHSEFHLNM